MTFKTPPALLQKVLGFKAFQHREGKFFLFDVPGIMNPVYMKVYEQKLLLDKLGIKKTNDLIYSLGYRQGIVGIKMTSERFGYAETIKDKAELLKFTLAQSDLIGLGHFEWKRIDFKEELFIVSGASSFAEEYKKFFGQQLESVDFFFRGEIAALVESVIGKKVLAIEKDCLAKQNRECVFIIRPIDKWDRKDADYLSQKVDLEPDFKELGSKRDPYIIS